MKFSPAFRASAYSWVGFSPPAYEPAFVDAFKDSVPYFAWDAVTKTWWFESCFQTDVLKLSELYWPDLRSIFVPTVAQPALSLPPRAEGPSLRNRRPSPYAILGVNPMLGDIDIREAYEALRDSLKEDGSPEPLAEVEEAYTEILKERGLSRLNRR